MAAQTEPPLDEVQWRDHNSVLHMQGIHSNSVLFYFAQSPFFDKTSNNAVLANQALFNPAMYHLIQTRDAFEGRLREMSGLEFMVAQEPAETAPGTGTGIWVIRKQTRRKRDPEDEIVVHATYYIVGECVYMAPTLGQILSFRMTTVSSALNKSLPAADAASVWSPSRGRTYNMVQQPTSTPRLRNTAESKENTPKPDAKSAVTKTANSSADPRKSDTLLSSSSDLVRHAEHSMLIHLQSGGEYEDENPIGGRPGAFNLSKTGRTFASIDTSFKNASILDIATKKTKEGNVKAGDKAPKPPTGSSRIKRKRSKTGQTPTSM
ncbi:MED6 mediator sub complex component-domain-containing protein [Xylaria sp. CBS 124048]|nr:MED6 mediator sub complex component-domain-containing protein [Xylaria sp. CBS 124048]